MKTTFRTNVLLAVPGAMIALCGFGGLWMDIDEYRFLPRPSYASSILAFALVSLIGLWIIAHSLLRRIVVGDDRLRIYSMFSTCRFSCFWSDVVSYGRTKSIFEKGHRWKISSTRRSCKLPLVTDYPSLQRQMLLHLNPEVFVREARPPPLDRHPNSIVLFVPGSWNSDVHAHLSADSEHLFYRDHSLHIDLRWDEILFVERVVDPASRGIAARMRLILVGSDFAYSIPEPTQESQALRNLLMRNVPSDALVYL